MSDEIQPALTPDEWAATEGRYYAELWPEFVGVVVEGKSGIRRPNGDPLGVPRLHSAAALALHGQPFGFTHAHVARLRSLVDAVRRADNATAYLLTGDVLRIADRIAALLRPNA